MSIIVLNCGDFYFILIYKQFSKTRLCATCVSMQPVSEGHMVIQDVYLNKSV